MYSFPKFEPVHFSMFNSVASWPAHRFCRRQVGWSGIPISLRIFHSLLWFTQSKALAYVVNEAEVDIFLEFPCLFYDPVDAANLISDSSAFSKSSLYIWKFLVHVVFFMLKTSLKNFEHYLASMWNECNCMIVWTFFGIALLWGWNVNWCFPILRRLLSFPSLLAHWVKHFHSIIF